MAPRKYPSPDGKGDVAIQGTAGTLFSDDFGGAAVDVTKWDVIDGGLSAVAQGVVNTQVPGHPAPSFSQGAIGSGVVGITDSVANSQLAVVMPTTINAERWYLSKEVFTGRLDFVAVINSISQRLAANSITIGMVEVDIQTGIPLLNPNLAGQFTNYGGMELGQTTNAVQFSGLALGDSSPAVVSIAGSAVDSFTGAGKNEMQVAMDVRDIAVNSLQPDATLSRGNAPARVSTQCPNSMKVYKLLIRFLNVGTAASATTVNIGRVYVVNNYEQRVQISGGEGDMVSHKGIPVNIVNGNGMAFGYTIGVVSIGPSTGVGNNGKHKLQSAATTNATSVRTTQNSISSGYLRNRAATEKYFKLYDKASAPTVGTDTPVLTIGIPAASFVNLGDVVGAGAGGLHFTNGIAYAITGAYADSDTTAVAAGDVDVNLVMSA